ncbi:hypothetical protein J437_LFUL017722 [Ladona fulva]|uniref:BLOC-1 subunit 6 n=1 Tax=Ladona fulva TaxID=123851 RepID=A0A8K0KG40_LADFU|nr:hypothetical protein J437_LFUL017722 [Ladona fulva]
MEDLNPCIINVMTSWAVNYKGRFVCIIFLVVFILNILDMTEIQNDSQDGTVQSGNASKNPFTCKETVSQLSEGLMSQYSTDLARVKTQIDELIKGQSSLIEKLESENARFAITQETYDLQETFTKVKHYHTKLESIKKEMAQIHERTAKVKKRAMKLQHNCQKEALMREQRKEEQLQREQQLIAKPGVSRKSKP